MEGKKDTVFVLGGPGSGKGTQCQLLASRKNCVTAEQNLKISTIGTGDLIRAELHKDTDQAKIIKDCLDQGKLVPSEITCGLVKKQFEECEGDTLVVLDGYPRNFENVREFEKQLASSVNLIKVIYIRVSEDVMRGRIMKRAEKEDRDAYDKDSDICNKRISSFFEETLPVIEQYAEEGILEEIDGELEVEEVYERICQMLDI
ncbi:unnamed protein product [Moneuplotes crassus]|uniref:Adenylate kinase n=1 Tax=Euplotes crassus TaxID=5936 RepID=A0AAD1XXA2_EUPCR|nr:unnamed protein product [Moneuplotes crassus]